MARNKNRRLSVLWVDEIQKGPNDKVNLIGVYGTEMRLPKPTSISLYAFIEVSTPLDNPFKSVSITVKSGSETVVDFKVPTTAIEQAVDNAKESEVPSDATVVRTAFRIGLPLSGVKVVDQRSFRVGIETEEGAMYSDETLFVKVISPSQPEPQEC